jgi:Kef-type K+ transport system membrane component KefB
MNIILLFGLVLLAALLAGRLGDLVGIPQVVGYILIGLLFGNSGLNLLSFSMVDSLTPLVNIALAMIGFMVGGELKYGIFRRYGWQFFTILLCEGILSMIMVTTLVWMWTGSPAIAILLGALSSATAPAATVDVLWQYKSRGPVTTTILAIVALDDGLGLILFGFAFAFAKSMLSSGNVSIVSVVFDPLLEIFLSLGLGCSIGFILDHLLPRIKGDDNLLVLDLGTILLAAGLAITFDLSLIMVAMAAGCWLANTPDNRNEKSFVAIKAFTPPIYTLFFVLVGARLKVNLLPELGGVGLLYIFGRTAGKWIGAYIGARLSGAADTVRKYLGLALFSQAGIALGLALHVAQQFSSLGPEGRHLGGVIINVIAATTFIVQIIGPPAVKLAIKKSRRDS